MTIALAATGTRTSGNAGTTTTVVTHPGTAIIPRDNLALLIRSIKPETATASAETLWTSLSSGTGGTGSSALDTGPTRVAIDYRIGDGTTGGTSTTFDQANSPNCVSSQIANFTRTKASWETPVAVFGSDTTHGTSFAATATSSMDFAVGDVIVLCVSLDTDSTTVYTAVGLTATGITFGATQAFVANAGGVSQNNDCGHVWYYSTVTAGSGTQTPSMTLTGGPSACGAVAFVRLRESDPTPGSPPASVAGCVFWLDADDASTFTFSSGVLASQWNDKAGTNHAVQATVGSQPSRNGTSPNGKTTVTFDGSADFMLSSMSSATKPTTIFAVVGVTDTAAIKTIHGAGQNGGLQWRIEANETQQILKQSVAGIGTSSTGISTSTYAVLCVTYSNTGAYAFFVNGSADGSGTNDQTFVAQHLSIGRSESGGIEYYAGAIAEIIKYNTNLGTTDRQAVEAYLTAKWITLAQSSIHPRRKPYTQLRFR